MAVLNQQPLPPPGQELGAADEPNARAICEALIELGERAAARAVADHIKLRHGIVLEEVTVEVLRLVLIERTKAPPGPDQPPPEDTRPRSAGRPDRLPIA